VVQAKRKGDTVRALIHKLACRDGPQSGQTMAEYAIVLAVIVVGVLAAFTGLSTAIQGGIDTVSTLIDGIT
jgi:Flp pilus assembly pilin Flp